MTDKIQVDKLYIIMRQDMASMSVGRTVAQASHVTSDVTNFMTEQLMRHQKGNSIVPNLHAWVRWRNATGTFGTVIALSNRFRFSEGKPSFLDLKQLGVNQSGWNFEEAALEYQIPFGVTVDPEYRVSDGHSDHYLAVPTGVWMFVHAEVPEDAEIREALRSLKML